MASLLTSPKPFILIHQSQVPFSLVSPSPLIRSKLDVRRSSLRVSAVAQKWEPSKVLPQADRVLIRIEELPEKSAGGVLLPKSAVKFERYLMGEILSVGGDVGAGELEAGKKVLFSDINAYDVVPAAKKFRHAGIAPELEEKLNIMFSQVVATGDDSYATSIGNVPIDLQHTHDEDCYGR